MITRMEMQGYWNQLKGQIRDRWGEITDDDLQRAQGNTERVVGIIQEKTGESRREIENFISSVIQEGETMAGQVKQRGREYLGQAAKAAEDGYHQIEHQLEAGYDEARQLVKKYPSESLLIAAGVGALAGVAMCLLMRPNHS